MLKGLINKQKLDTTFDRDDLDTAAVEAKMLKPPRQFFHSTAGFQGLLQPCSCGSSDEPCSIPQSKGARPQFGSRLTWFIIGMVHCKTYP